MWDAVEEGGFYGSRVHAGDFNAVLAEFFEEGVAEAGDGEFGSTVSAHLRDACESCDGGDIDDMALAAAFHGGQEGFEAIKYAVDIDVEHFMPLLEGGMIDIDEVAHAGVVDEEVGGADGLESIVRGVLDLLEVANIGLDEVEQGVLVVGLGEAPADDGGALVEELDGRGAADAMANACDDGGFTIEVHGGGF